MGILFCSCSVGKLLPPFGAISGFLSGKVCVDRCAPCAACAGWGAVEDGDDAGGVFSRWAGLLLIVGAVLSPAGFVIGIFGTAVAPVLVSLGLGWMGYTLWITKGEAVPQLVPAS